MIQGGGTVSVDVNQLTHFTMELGLTNTLPDILDFTRRDGTGGECIYGGNLQDEGGFKRKHDIEGTWIH